MVVTFTHSEAEFLLLEVDQDVDERIALIKAWATHDPFAMEMSFENLLTLDHFIEIRISNGLDYRGEKLLDGEPVLSLVYKIWDALAEVVQESRYAGQSTDPDTDKARTQYAETETGPEEDAAT